MNHAIATILQSKIICAALQPRRVRINVSDHGKYKLKFWNSEPKHSEDTINRVVLAYPSYLSNDVEMVLKIIPKSQHEPHENYIGLVIVNGEPLRIPSRVYFPEPSSKKVASLSDMQKVILFALYTRHHDGFLREKYIKQLIESSQPWVPPYVLQLIGEYVIEIIDFLSRSSGVLTQSHFKEFIQENDSFNEKICRRVVSYWKCYFHWDMPIFTKHSGYVIMQEIGMWNPKVAPRLTRR